MATSGVIPGDAHAIGTGRLKPFGEMNYDRLTLFDASPLFVEGFLRGDLVLVDGCHGVVLSSVRGVLCIEYFFGKEERKEWSFLLYLFIIWFGARGHSS